MWWKQNRQRLIQTNISELDADLDVGSLVATLNDLSANVLLLNTGGIVAFYPTELDFHYRSPHVKRDLTGEVLRACHDRGIRYVARFDFSKAHRSIYEGHPEWFYRSPKGEIVDYNDMVHTCVNGLYQRECSLEIVGEALSRYDVDGVFFNMFGYQTRDYSGRYYGICHCESCKAEFHRMYSAALPTSENPDDEVFQKYSEFKQVTAQQMLERIRDLVKQHNPAIGVSTYATHAVDIVKKESNTEIGRPQPVWVYSASENVKSVEDTWNEKSISNVCINAIGIRHRFVGVSKENVAVRLYQSIASGSGLDFCIIGPFKTYPDRENLDTVRDIYRFHHDNEEYFGDFSSVAEVALVKPARFVSAEQEDEYLGFFRMLKEDHVLFDVMHQEGLSEAAAKIPRYRLIIFPDVRQWSTEDLRVFAEARSGEGATHFLSTGLSFSDKGSQKFLAQHFACRFTNKSVSTTACYIQVGGEVGFDSFADRRWIAMDGHLQIMEPAEDARPLLQLISAGRYGPPERVGVNEPTGLFGCFAWSGSEGKSWFLPWSPGALYQRHGFADHKRTVMDVVHSLNLGNSGVRTNAPPSVELFYDRIGDGTPDSPRGTLLQLLNLSGFNGVTFHAPVDIHDVAVQIHDPLCTITGVRGLTAAPFSWDRDQQEVRITIAILTRYAAIFLETNKGESI